MTTDKIDEHLEDWRDHLKVLRGLGDATVDTYAKYIDEFFGWMIMMGRTTDPQDVEREDIEDYLAHLFYDRGNSNTTRRTKLIALSLFWRYLLYKRVIEVDFVSEIPRPKVWTAPIMRFTRADVYAMLAAIDSRVPIGMRDTSILLLLSCTGVRAGEVVRLNLGDVDPTEHTRIHIVDSKHHNHRDIDLWQAPSLILNRWIAFRLASGAGPKSPLFNTYKPGNRPTANRMSIVDINRLVKRYARAAKIRKVRVHPHMFRATHASDLRHIKGYDIGAIAARLGHKNIATTDRYLPGRERITKTYPSLAAYWADLPKILGGSIDETGD